MHSHSPDFELHVCQIAALGVWQIVTGGTMKRRLEVGDDHRWKEKNGLFVTLRKGGVTRGSMGRLETETSLQELLFETGAMAATHDARYPPVSESELSKIEIEVTLLSEIKKMNGLQDIELGSTGLIVTRGEKRGVLLPHVPVEQNWSAELFLEACCEKAGLSHKAWKDSNTLVEYFSSVTFLGGNLMNQIKDYI